MGRMLLFLVCLAPLLATAQDAIVQPHIRQGTMTGIWEIEDDYPEKYCSLSLAISHQFAGLGRRTSPDFSNGPGQLKAFGRVRFTARALTGSADAQVLARPVYRVETLLSNGAADIRLTQRPLQSLDAGTARIWLGEQAITLEFVADKQPPERLLYKLNPRESRGTDILCTPVDHGNGLTLQWCLRNSARVATLDALSATVSRESA